jgi:ABC-type dipeptide/oligopeptide/nickel transport system ATPase component
MNTILLIGACGSGKTYVMNELLSVMKTKCARANMFRFRIDNEKKVAILGVYDGTTFQGSDRLSMSIMRDAYKMRKLQIENDWCIVCEGQRFSNHTFINIFDPVIIKIADNGELGRQKRNSTQSERHIKLIQTQIRNIKEHYLVKNSSEALLLIKKMTKI